MKDVQLIRIRIDTIRELLANHKGEDERGQFKVTPYKLLQYGFIPNEYRKEYDELYKKKGEKDIPSNSLSLQEQLSYSNYFILNSEKVCGQMVQSSSGGFAVRVKGSRADVERVINQTLNNHKESLSVQQRIRIALALAKARARSRERQN